MRNNLFVIGAIGIALGLAIGIVTHFAIILQWLSYILIGLAALALLTGIVWLVIWRDRKRDELHERWFMQGAQTGVKIVVATVQGEADRHQAMGKVTTEAIRVLKSSGALDPVYPPRLPMPNDSNGDVIDTSFKLTGLDDNDKWQNRVGE